MSSKSQSKVRPEDISRRMFQDALAAAYERVERNRSALARAIGEKPPACWNWLHGKGPTAKKMQLLYYKLLDVQGVS